MILWLAFLERLSLGAENGPVRFFIVHYLIVRVRFVTHGSLGKTKGDTT